MTQETPLNPETIKAMVIKAKEMIDEGVKRRLEREIKGHKTREVDSVAVKEAEADLERIRAKREAVFDEEKFKNVAEALAESYEESPPEQPKEEEPVDIVTEELKPPESTLVSDVKETSWEEVKEMLKDQEVEDDEERFV